MNRTCSCGAKLSRHAQKCLRCHLAGYRKRIADEKRERVNQRLASGYKTCSMCCETMAMDEFHNVHSSCDGKVSACRRCLAFSKYKANARKRMISWELSRGDFYNLYDGTCVYCAAPSRGVDRLDNGRGYCVDNVVPCCGTCNQMKLNLPVTQWIEQMTKIISHYQSSSRFLAVGR